MAFFGPKVLVTLRENRSTTRRMYLPPRYSTIWTEKYIESILGGKEKYYSVKRGKCEDSDEINLGLESAF
jgi:hypothetical protein